MGDWQARDGRGTMEQRIGEDAARRGRRLGAQSGAAQWPEQRDGRWRELSVTAAMDECRAS
jgi:hypothetical protein